MILLRPVSLLERNCWLAAVNQWMTTTSIGTRRWRPPYAAKPLAARVASWFNRVGASKMPDDEPIPTRASMLQRLKDPADRTTWEEFHRTYRGLIHGVARRAGLNETEAEEVVQETLIAVAGKMPGFTYDPVKDSFKGWLLQITRWRIADQFRKRAIVGLETPSTGSGPDAGYTGPSAPHPSTFRTASQRAAPRRSSACRIRQVRTLTSDLGRGMGQAPAGNGAGPDQAPGESRPLCDLPFACDPRKTSKRSEAGAGGERGTDLPGQAPCGFALAAGVAQTRKGIVVGTPDAGAPLLTRVRK